jgi:hypothetical protein
MIQTKARGGEYGSANQSGEKGRVYAETPANQNRAIQAVEKAVKAAQAHPGRSLALAVLGMAGVRIGLALTYAGYLGVDGGAYILGLQEVQAGELLGVSFGRPPLSPGWILYPFMEWVGGAAGYNLYSAVLSFAIIPPFYLLARQSFGAGWGALATGAFMLDWSLGAEMFVTGVVPLLGFGMLALALWGMVGLGVAPGRRHWAAIIIALPMAALTNQTSVGIGAVAIPLAWLMLPNKRAQVAALTMGAAVAVAVAFPYYLDVLPGSARVSYPGALVDFHPWQSSSHYLLALTGLVVGGATFITKAPPAVRAMGLMVMVHGVLNVFISHDEVMMNIFYRSGLWMMVPLWVIGVHYARAYLPRLATRPLVLFALAFLALGAYGYQDTFYGQAYYSDLAGPDVLAALDSIPPEHITRIGTNAESRGFYLAALSGAPAVWVQNALPAESYKVAELAARCSLGWVTCADHGYVSHWLIDTKRTQAIAVRMDRAPNPLNPWGDVGALAPWLTKTFERGTVQVWTAR